MNADQKINPDENADGKKNKIYALIVIFCGVMAYLPVSECGFVWDDDNYITDNYTLRSVSGFQDIWLKPGATTQYYPLTHTTFWIEYHLWKLNPLGYHLVNVILHIVSGLMIGVIASRMRIPGAWLAAVIFTVHPVHVESVAWVTERKNVLSTCFYLASFLAFLRLNILGQFYAEKPKRPLVAYLFSFFLYVCALLAKTVTCSLPVILLLVAWCNTRICKKVIIRILPFFAAGLVFGLFTIHVEKTYIGAHGFEWSLSFLERCLIAGRALWFYVGKLLHPGMLMFVYPRWNVDVGDWQQYLYPLSMIFMAAAFLKCQQRIGRGPILALLCFAVTLFPALGFFDVFPMKYSFVADHFQYLASIPIILIFCAAMAHLSQKTVRVFSVLQSNAANSVPFFPLVAVLISSVIVTFGIMTWTRCHAFQDEEHLWLDTLSKNPRAWMAHNNIGLIYAGKNDFQKAIQHYNTALHLNPNHAYAHNNLAMAWDALGNNHLAMIHYKKALDIRPNDYRILNNCGDLLFRKKKYEQAVLMYDHVLKLNPNAIGALTNIGLSYAGMEDFEKAAYFLTKAQAMEPENRDVRNHVDHVLQKKDKTH